ncbi:hypothetical protein AX17_004609 [Amanita inopinata Kibby_2008]|nr:hypothetical protein AX17_004609 [Amanita inopinata Kibby_2008]
MEDHVNMFGGSPLNRLSWLRSSHTFLNAIISLPTTKWLLFNAGKPLTMPDQSKEVIALLTTDDVKSVLGSEPYFGQGKERGEMLPDHKDAVGHSPLEAVRHHDRPIVFLGVLESDSASVPLLQNIIEEPLLALSKLGGTPYFAMEVSDFELSSEGLDQLLKNTGPGRDGLQLSWAEPRGLSLQLDSVTAAIFAMARSMVDWNSRNKYCPACGCKTYSMWGGWKVSCTSLLPWVDNSGRLPCPTIKGLHNFMHPRTDAVVIMVTIDETGDKILLGRGKKFPGRFYSALAGFIEPGETFEDAVRREMWEEAGITVWDVRYHSAQPWPYPANLMVGFYARADSKQVIRTDLDNELVGLSFKDARWFTRQEVLSILEGRAGALLSQTDYKKLTDKHEGREEKSLAAVSQALAPAENTASAQPAAQANTNDPIKLPPTTAIAGLAVRTGKPIGTVVNIDDEILELGRKKQDLLKKRAKATDDIDRYKVAIAPHNKLPEDVLRHIFLMCAGAPGHHLAYAREADTPECLAVVREWLSRAGNTPISISLSLDCIDTLTRRELTSNYRFKNLSLILSPEDLQELQQKTMSQVPHLVRITFA